MKKILFIFGLFLVFLCSCSEEEQNVVDETDAQAVLKAALESYYADDLDGYLKYSDFDAELDSVQIYFISKALNQRLSLIKRDKKGVIQVEPTTNVEQNDSILNIYYNITYGDNSTESFMQKMQKQGDCWRLRLRN